MFEKKEKTTDKNKHYITAKESRNIAKQNLRTIKQLKKKRAAYTKDDYITEMKDDRNVVEFDDLHTYFFTDNGVVKAVNGVSFDIPQGATVGVVGESGCGKSVTSLSLMQLVQAPMGQVVSGSIRSSADVVKAIALGADACYIATAALLAMGCHLCRSCQTGGCCWGIATQRPDLVKRLDPQQSAERLVNLVTAWKHEIKEMMGGMGINSIEALRGNRVMLRGIHLTDKELEILGVAHAGE